MYTFFILHRFEASRRSFWSTFLRCNPHPRTLLSFHGCTFLLKPLVIYTYFWLLPWSFPSLFSPSLFSWQYSCFCISQFLSPPLVLDLAVVKSARLFWLLLVLFGHVYHLCICVVVVRECLIFVLPISPPRPVHPHPVCLTIRFLAPHPHLCTLMTVLLVRTLDSFSLPSVCVCVSIGVMGTPLYEPCTIWFL